MPSMRFSSDDPELDDLYADLAAAHLQPLWLLTGLLPSAPNRLSPYLWRWKKLRDLAVRSGGLVGIDRGGDRRVLSLAHPDLDGLPFATHTLWGAVQFLGGGELAPAHRHSPSALRFVLEGSGVWTLVNGDPVRMEAGDLILTPSYSWHEHHNPGTEPMIWFDGLDLPLVRGLNAVFFDPGPAEISEYTQLGQSLSEQYFASAGLLPTAGVAVTIEHPGAGKHSPLLAYRWRDTDARLEALLLNSGTGRASVRYSDPRTGGDVMPTLRAEMHRLQAGHRTPATRTVGSAIWVVYRGSGRSTVAGVQLDWAAGDIFVTPSWAATSHEAAEPADLFMLSDAPVIEAAGLGRTEVLAAE